MSCDTVYANPREATILSYINVSSWFLVHLKPTQCLYVNYISVKINFFKKNKKQTRTHPFFLVQLWSLPLTPWRAESCCLVAKSCPTLCDPRDCSPPGSAVHRILQARRLEWFVVSFSRIFLIQGVKLCLLHRQMGSLPLSLTGR